MGEEVALEFAADVEQAVASVRELAGSAQELAGTAKEAADGVASLAEPANAAAEGTQRLADASHASDEALAEMRAALEENAGAVAGLTDAVERLSAAVDDNTTATDANATAQKGAAGASEAAVASHGKYKLALIGVAVGTALAVKAASDYQDASTHLVTDAGESAKNLGMVQQGMLAISAAAGTSAKDVVNGMYHVESAGYHGAAGLSVLKVAAEGAKVGGANLDTISKTLTGTLNAYGQTSSNSATQTKYATSMMNQLIATVGAGDMRMEDLASSLGNVAPVAAAAKIKFSEVGGALATMTSQNMSAQQATQDLRHSIMSLENPNKVQQKELAALGLSARQVQDSLGTKGLAATLQMVTEAAHKNSGALGQTYTQALAKAMGGTTGLTTALMLSGSRMSTFKGNAEAVAAAAKKGGDSVANWSAIQGTFKFKMDQAKASIEDMGISLGTALLPAVSAIVGPIAHFLSLVAANKAASIALAVVIGGLLAGALGNKLKNALTDVREGFKFILEDVPKMIGNLLGLTAAQEAQTAATEAGTVAQEEMDAAQAASPIGLIILAIVALVIAIYELVKHWRTVWHFITSIVDDAVKFIRDHWKAIVAWLVDPVGMVVMEIRKHWTTIKHDASEAIDFVVGFVKSHWPLLLAIITGPIGLAVLYVVNHWDQLRHETAHLVDDVVSFFQALPGRILSALGDFASLLWNAGVALVQGLINGIKSMLGPLGSVASSIGGFIANLKGPLPKDLVLLVPHGRAIIQGLMDGITSKKGELASLLSQVTGGIPVAAGAGLAGGGLASTIGGGHMNVTVTVAPGAGSLADARWLQGLQQVFQEAALRYNLSNPSNGLAIPGGRL